MSQRELARAGETSQAAVARYETGRVLPDLRTLDRLLGVCGQRLTVDAVPTRRTGRESATTRPVAIPDDILDCDATTALGVVELPLHIRWSGPPRTYDLDKRRERARVYEQAPSSTCGRWCSGSPTPPPTSPPPPSVPSSTTSSTRRASRSCSTRCPGCPRRPSPRSPCRGTPGSSDRPSPARRPFVSTTSPPTPATVTTCRSAAYPRAIPRCAATWRCPCARCGGRFSAGSSSGTRRAAASPRPTNGWSRASPPTLPWRSTTPGSTRRSASPVSWRNGPRPAWPCSPMPAGCWRRRSTSTASSKGSPASWRPPWPTGAWCTSPETTD